MSLISIIMPCYNAEKYLEVSVQSIIDQSFKSWELIIVNDGSKDKSKKVALELAERDDRIKVVSKENGGYVSARLFGYKLISAESRYVIFYDADDKMNKEMLMKLFNEMDKDEKVGAVYCDHIIMDENGISKDRGIDMPRFVPTKFWLRTLKDEVVTTPFISIFCWTKMIEPMTLIRRTAYEQTGGWDIDFGIGTGNIGEGVYLFSEIALNWKVKYVNVPLYNYRRHSAQMSAVSMEKMYQQAKIVNEKWKRRLKHEDLNKAKLKAALMFYNYRLMVFKRRGSLLHQIRYKPLSGFKSIFLMLYAYLRSTPLIINYRILVD